MEILDGERMRRVDRRTIDDLGIPGLLLMEAAGIAVTEALLQDYPDLARLRPLILCGKGNNGGDGLVVARQLARRDVATRVVLLARGEDLRGDAATNLRAARAVGVHVEEIVDADAWSELARAALAGRPLVLDAILGTGISGGARGLAARVIEDLARSAARVVSVDLPSGLDAGSERLEGVAVRAERTYTLCRPKLPLIFPPAAERAGAWRVLPIGIPDDVVAAERGRLSWFDGSDAAARLPARPRDAHKGTYGHLLVVAGGRGKTGAAVLAGRAALRSGVGLVTLATAEGSQREIASRQAEWMTESLAQTADGRLAARAARPALRLLAERDALAVGPGLGTSAETRRLVAALIRHGSKPAVIDADALNAVAAGRGGLDALARVEGDRILTPHPGEAGRLLGRSAAAVQRDRRAAAEELARRSGSVVVLKGALSLVAAPDGRISVNASGNPGMATGGAGDVLTGILGALLARGLSTWNAARLGTYVHGDAGDRASRSRGEESLVAGDLVDHLDQAWRARQTPWPGGARIRW